jgi:hypothetical protein
VQSQAKYIPQITDGGLLTRWLFYGLLATEVHSIDGEAHARQVRSGVTFGQRTFGMLQTLIPFHKRWTNKIEG